MRMKQKLATAAVCAVTCLTGCGYEMEVAVNPDLSYQAVNHIYFTEAEKSGFEQEYDCSLETELQENGFTYAGKETVDGVEQYHYFADQDMETLGMDAFIINEKNKNVILTAESAKTYTDIGTTSVTNDWTEYTRAVYSVKCPFRVYDTNGVLQADGQTVVYDLTKMSKSAPRGWAVASSAVKNASGVTVKGAKKNGAYQNPVDLKLVTGGVITEFTINGENIGSDSAYLKEEGKYTVKYQTASGKRKTMKFCIDRTAPKTNVKNNKTYKKVTVNFSDRLSGIQSATLNGKKIKSGKTVKKPGAYKLVVTDQAGNRMTRKFKVK